MRVFGWILGGLFLAEGVMSLVWKKDLVVRLNAAVGKKLPDPVEKTLKKATDMNSTAIKAQGINNLIAGAGMVLVSTLLGLKTAKQ